jgi:hypothetical protein
VLIEDRREGAGTPVRVVPRRRYRLARVRLNARSTSESVRFDYLKRAHD